MQAMDTSEDDPKIVEKRASEEQSSSSQQLPTKNPQSEMVELAQKHNQRKLEYQQERVAASSSSWRILPSFLVGGSENKDLNSIYRTELKKGRVHPIQEKKSDLDTFVHQISTLSPDELEAMVEQNAADLKPNKKKVGSNVGTTSRELSRSAPMNEKGGNNRNGFDSHSPQHQQQNNYLDQPNDGPSTNKGKNMPSRRKSKAATAQSELLAESVERKKQQQRQSSFFRFFSDATSQSPPDLNDVYRHERLMRKVEASRTSLPTTTTNKKNLMVVDLEQEVMPIQTAVSEASMMAVPASSDSVMGALSKRTSKALLAPATFLHSSVSNLLMDDDKIPARYHSHHEEEEDAAEALHNRDLDESKDCQFVLHLVS